MPAQALFGISVAFGFIAWGIVAAQYFWPLLRTQARGDALRPLLLLHSFRFIGLAFLVKGVVAPGLHRCLLVSSPGRLAKTAPRQVRSMTLDGEHFLGFAHALQRVPTHR